MTTHIVKPDSHRSSYLGMAKGDLDGQWFAKYWQPKMAPLAKHITEALLTGPQASPLLPSFDEVAVLSEEGYQNFENGFGISEDGAVVVAALTIMPKVSPIMLDWWFGWHGSDSRRYKLWNPSAHLSVCWQDDLAENLSKTYKDGYLNRTSLIEEYVGSTMMSLAIQFVQPATFGIDESLLQDPEKATAICGRVGLSEIPIDSGCLIHYVRQTKEGSEMRSRFWLGGKFLAARNGFKLPNESSDKKNNAEMLWQAYSLLIHCAKEMSHLSSFLPDIYYEFQTRC